MDPFLDVVQLLRPRATLWSKIEGFGRWGLAFRKRDDLLFCRVERGECHLLRPKFAPMLLRPDDFVLIHTSTPFVLTSDPTMEPEDSEELVAAAKSVSLQLGEGTESPVTLRGGRFVFDTANESLLWELLPSLLHVAADDTSSWRVRSLLKLNEMETLQPGPGSEFLIARLMELILVEMLRRETPKVDDRPTGLIAGLHDPVLASALLASASEPERRGYSQAAQAMAMLAGLIPIDNLHPNIDYAFMEPDGSPHDGVTRWNNPTYSYRTLRALSDAGLSSRAVRHLRERYAPYLAGNPHNHVEPSLQGSLGGPLPEYFVSRDDLHLQPGQLNTAQPPDETGSHGWGAVPLLWAHDTLLGVRIAQPGGGRLDIAPQSGGLPYISGTTFTPHGPVKVDWRPASQTLRIEKPKGIIARITLPGVLSTTNTGQPPSGCKVISTSTLLCDGSRTTYRIAKRGLSASSTTP